MTMSLLRTLVVERVSELINDIGPADLTDAELLELAAFREGVAERLPVNGARQRRC